MPCIIEETMEILKKNRIEVARKKKIWLNEEQAKELYREHINKDWFPDLLTYMTK